ncbi:DUF445 domain-containing protein [Halobacillus massiliensis]|uniref:DUF445 domain-containing protein n=1 Tax=Halobacillus massiliensis TaxID=1926286 RepID=UPI0009E614F5|nr:DUF445 family protein [Halobacillus massiliensis]
MNTFITISLMVAIGAVIGGLTNSLAIRMLFRPYRAIYMGKFRLPFTPGLIPKRQNDLAKQMGRTVVEHLLTAEGLKKNIEGTNFQNKLTSFAQREVEKLLSSPESLKNTLEKVNLTVDKDSLEKSLHTVVEQRYEQLMNEWRHQKVEDVLPANWRKKAEAGTNELAYYLQEKVYEFLNSPEGKWKVGALIDNYLENQGFLGNMIQSFMGSERVIDRVHPVLIRYVTARETTEWLQGMLQSELHAALNQPVGEYEQKIGKDHIHSALRQTVSKALPLEQWLNTSIKEWAAPFKSKLITDFIPALIPVVTAMLAERIDRMMQSMKLSEIVQEEVESFDVGRLEEMVLGISRREFKMITYLGALLGGIIGLFQGILVLFL